MRFGASWVLCALVVTLGCGSESEDGAAPGSESEVDGAVGSNGGTPGEAATPTSLALDATAGELGGALKVGATRTLSVRVTLSDGTVSEVTADAAWTSSDAAVLTVDGGVVTAVGAGSATVTAAYAGLEASQTLEVEAAVLTGLVIAPQLDTFTVGVPENLTVTAIYDSGSEVDVTAQVEWETSNPDIATVDGEGVVEATHGGAVTLTATLDGERTTLEATVGCDYPRYARALRYGAVVPPLYWNGAYNPDGSKFDFELSKVHCDVEYKDVDVIFFIISAGWCTPCTIYAQRLLSEYQALQDEGAMIVIVEAETADFGPADSDYAQRHLDRIIGDAYAVRVGDYDTQPLSNFLREQPIVQGFPTTIAVRTRDMQVITDSNHSQYYLPLRLIAENPEADWSNPGIPPFNDRCGPGDEEATEPNDQPGQATPLEEGRVTGGICNENMDFYEVQLDGAWEAALEFDPTVGDLDIYVWDVGQNQPLQVGGQIIGSNGTSGDEVFTHRGRALLGVMGFQGASAGYTLTLQAQ